MKVDLTGHPFVDVGFAGLCALAGVQNPSALTQQAIQKAIDEAIRLLTSQSAFMKPEKGNAFATGLYSLMFPNSPLPNPSVKDKAQRLRTRLEEYLQAIFQPEPQKQDGWCFACGEPAYFRVGHDRCPMVGYGEWSNFNPEFKPGATICGLCALAVQFLPFAVMRTRPDGGRLWILHVYDVPLMASIAQNYTLRMMDWCIAQNQPLSVYGAWDIQTDDGAILSLLCELQPAQLKHLVENRVPMSAYLFSNDNRIQNQYLTRREVLPEVLVFLSALKYYPESYQQFRNEVLLEPKLGEMVSRAIMNTQPIIRLCLDFESAPPRLRGSWRAHKLYAEEVLLMKSTFLSTVEVVGERIASHEDAKKWIQALRSDYTTVSNALLRLVKEGLMTKDEYYLIGKGEVMTTSQYLLGVIFALQNGESLPEDTQAELAGDRHPLIALVEQVGARIVAESERVKRLVQSLRSARNPDMIRRAFLRAVQEGVVRWNEFIQLCPPDDANTHFLARDYLLAYLFDTARNLLPAEDDTTTEEGGSNG